MVPNDHTGRLAPITIATYLDGNIGINLESINGGHGTYSVLSKIERDADPKPRPVNHWSNCEHANSFRR